MAEKSAEKGKEKGKKRRTRTMASIMAAAALAAGPEAAALPQPPQTLQSTAKPKTQISQKLTQGSCSFDVSRHRLTVQQGSRVFVSDPLDTPSTATAGRYLGIMCGANRTLLVTERKLVVTLGAALVRAGRKSLPKNKGYSAFSTPIDKSSVLGSKPVAWTSDDEQKQVFLLGANGRLAIDDVTRKGDIRTVDLSAVLELPPSSHPLFLQHHMGRLFVFQNSSRRIITIAIKGKNAVIKTNRVRSVCPPAPKFSKKKDALIADFGASMVTIELAKGRLTIGEAKK